MEPKIQITAGWALEHGLWDKVCDLKGLNVWAISEGLMDRNEEITLTLKEAQDLGIPLFPEEAQNG